MVADLGLWTAAVAAFAGGDYVTTKQGLKREGVEEAHPVSDVLIETVGVDVGMAGGKFAVLTVAVAGYLYAEAHAETEAYSELFPLALLVLGLGIVSHNLAVLQDA
jgi:uncharacterized membrane protein